jgi:hypothetical protein
MATTALPEIPQPEPRQLDWDKLARELNVDSPYAALQRAYQIAAYVAKVERSRDQKLLLKERGKYFELSLKSLKRSA